MRAFAVSLLCCSCATYHHLGTIEHGALRGPIEVGATRVYGNDIPLGAVVLEYRFGSLVDHAVPFDLRELRVEIGGHSAELYDPRRVVRPLPLSARAVGTERLMYVASGNADTTQVCVYLGTDCVEVLP